jgi:hypothetical protein
MTLQEKLDMIISRNNFVKNKCYLYVERDDHEYDHKEFGIDQIEEANNYRCECQSRWMSHCDYVYLVGVAKDGHYELINFTLWH